MEIIVVVSSIQYTNKACLKSEVYLISLEASAIGKRYEVNIETVTPKSFLYPGLTIELNCNLDIYQINASVVT